MAGTVRDKKRSDDPPRGRIFDKERVVGRLEKEIIHHQNTKALKEQEIRRVLTLITQILEIRDFLGKEILRTVGS